MTTVSLTFLSPINSNSSNVRPLNRLVSGPESEKNNHTREPANAAIQNIIDRSLLARNVRLAEQANKMVRAEKTNAGDLVYTAVNGSNQVQVKFSKLTKEAFRPSSLLKIAANRVADFPQEALKFFIALGIIEVKDLIFYPEKHPLSVTEFVDGQINPLGQVGFAAFMMANGMTSQPLQTILQNKNFAMKNWMISNMGMLAGSLSMHAITELGPISAKMTNCLKIDRTISNQNQQLYAKLCDDAFTEFHEKSIKDQLPTLTAMLATATFLTLGGSVFEYVVNKGVSAAAKSSEYILSKQIGLQLIQILSPAKKLQFIIKPVVLATEWIKNPYVKETLHTILFLEIQDYLTYQIKYNWENAMGLGPKLDESLSKIEALNVDLFDLENMSNETNRQSKYIKYELLASEIDHFSKLMSDWRAHLTVKPYESYNRWLQKISNLTAGYNLSKQFYRGFAIDVNDRNIKGHTYKKFDNVYPLYGVHFAEKNKNSNSNFSFLKSVFDPENYIFDVSSKIPRQLDFLQLVGERILGQDSNGLDLELEPFESYLELNKEKFIFDNYLFESDKNLSIREKDKILEIANSFKSKNINKIVESINFINSFTNHTSDIASRNLLKKEGRLSNLEQIKSSAGFQSYIYKLRKNLGNPTPFTIPGQGYLQGKYDLIIKENLVSPYNLEKLPFVTKNPLEYLMYQMINGPDVLKNESVVGDFEGFKADFIPPKMSNDFYYEKLFLNKPTGPHLFFDFGLNVIEPDKILGTRMNYLQFLTTKGKGLESVLFSSESSANDLKFDSWWEANVDPEFYAAWVDYNKKYRKIVRELYSLIKRNDDSITNRSRISSGVLKSLQQERKIYLDLLKTPYIKELLKSSVNHEKVEKLKKSFDALDQLFYLNEFGPITDEPLQKSEIDLLSKNISTEIDSIFGMIDNSMCNGNIQNCDPSIQVDTNEKHHLVAALPQALKNNLNQISTYAEILNLVKVANKLENEGLIQKLVCQEKSQNNSLLAKIKSSICK